VYVLRDGEIPRPYFAHVRAPGGVQVTRTHPPVEGKDLTDHATFHPGIWLAFGDLSGADFWRLKATVRSELVGEPEGRPGAGRFAVRNRYESGGKRLCEETARYAIRALPAGYLLLWDSEFRSDAGFSFGDQEEMGLGVRVATPIAVKTGGGTITDSAGRKNESGVWGRSADWCDYRGALGGKPAGVMLMPHPENFRKSWWHVRDYGLMVANPFGRNALTKGPKSKVEVGEGETFRLRFGVLVYTGDVDRDAAYRDYLRIAEAKSRRGKE
ncbi:MAG TPA: DUF6807 family protein, partial [Gemmataceae bacterium]